MTEQKTFTRKTVNRLRAAQEEIVELQAVIRTQAAKWLHVEEEELKIPLPLEFVDGEKGTTITLEHEATGGDSEGLRVRHSMPVAYLFASDEELDADYRKFQELKARFQAMGV